MSSEREAFEAWWTHDAEGTENKAAAFEGWQARAEWERSQSTAEVEKLKQDCRNYLHEVEQLKAQRDVLLEAVNAAFECGMVPTSTAKKGGASKHARQVVVADMLRDALATYRAA